MLNVPTNAFAVSVHRNTLSTNEEHHVLEISRMDPNVVQDWAFFKRNMTGLRLVQRLQH